MTPKNISINNIDIFTFNVPIDVIVTNDNSAFHDRWPSNFPAAISEIKILRECLCEALDMVEALSAERNKT